MAFRKYKTIGEVLETYQIELRTSDFLVNSKSVDVPDVLVKELDFVIRQNDGGQRCVHDVYQ